MAEMIELLGLIMEKKQNQQRVLIFCEDCGEKNFLSMDRVKKKGQEIEFRCQDCNYLNTMPLPESHQKDAG